MVQEHCHNVHDPQDLDHGEDGEGLGSLDQDKIHQEKDKKQLYL